MLEWLLGHSPTRERPVTAKREKLRGSESTAARGLEQGPQRALYLDSAIGNQREVMRDEAAAPAGW